MRRAGSNDHGGTSSRDAGEGPDEEQRAALQRIRRRMERERLAKDRYEANTPVSPIARDIQRAGKFQRHQPRTGT